MIFHLILTTKLMQDWCFQMQIAWPSLFMKEEIEDQGIKEMEVSSAEHALLD